MDEADSWEELKRRHGQTVGEAMRELGEAMKQVYESLMAFLNKHRDSIQLILRMLTAEARQMEEQEKHKRHIHPLRTKSAPYRQPMRHQVVNRKPIRQVARSRC
ncbi:hypothetical protein [Paenibacillus sp. DCT19]|uniref:hypothetical protein n=1 Tax=Paenibacillus sp. DCT19 TaxID=2211212 RepID=UPI000FE22327|nr:hypothetical protein [Paenibacillus sp. DCT19]